MVSDPLRNFGHCVARADDNYMHHKVIAESGIDRDGEGFARNAFPAAHAVWSGVARLGAWRIEVIRGPFVAIGIITHNIRRESHVVEDPGKIGGLDFAGKKAFSDCLHVKHIPIVPPDLPTYLRAEMISVIV